MPDEYHEGLLRLSDEMTSQKEKTFSNEKTTRDKFVGIRQIQTSLIGVDPIQTKRIVLCNVAGIRPTRRLITSFKSTTGYKKKFPNKKCNANGTSVNKV